VVGLNRLTSDTWPRDLEVIAELEALREEIGDLGAPKDEG